MYIEKTIPKTRPTIVAKKPIKNPVKKKDLIIDFFVNPSDLKIAISFVLFFIRIVSPDIMLKAATTIIRVNIKTLHFFPLLKLKKMIYLNLTKNIHKNLCSYFLFLFYKDRHLKDYLKKSLN